MYHIFFLLYNYLITSNLDQVDKLGTNWIENKYFLIKSEGKYKKAETGSYNPIQTVVLDQRPFGEYSFTSSTSYPVTASLGSKFQGTGYNNARFEGSKLIGADINVKSRQTVDGGPVVKVTQVNPNQIVFANNQLTTLDRASASDLIALSPLTSNVAVSSTAAAERGAGDGFSVSAFG